MTTLEEISERGFAVIADVISPEVITAVVDELQKLLLVGSRRAGLRNLFHVSPLSRTLVHSETLQSLISPLLGKDVKCVRGLYFDKRREANWKVIVASRPDHRCKTTERLFLAMVHGLRKPALCTFNRRQRSSNEWSACVCILMKPTKRMGHWLFCQVLIVLESLTRAQSKTSNTQFRRRFVLLAEEA